VNFIGHLVFTSELVIKVVVVTFEYALFFELLKRSTFDIHFGRDLLGGAHDSQLYYRISRLNCHGCPFPTQEQLSDSNFAAAWRAVDKSIAAANFRVKILREQGEEPSQEELNDSPTLLRAWNTAICWDLVRAGKKPTQEQLSDSNFAAAWNGVIKSGAYLNKRMKHFEDTRTKPTDDELGDNPKLKERWEKYEVKMAEVNKKLEALMKNENEQQQARKKPRNSDEGIRT
jgi:hypothetical protein